MSAGQQQTRASKIVKMVLNGAKRRLKHIQGNDKLALQSEYKEWLIDSSFDDDVWFSTSSNQYKKNSE